VLIAAHHSVSSCICRYVLEVTNVYICVEISVNDDFSLLVNNQYSSPKSDNKSVKNDFNSLEIKLDTQSVFVER
jgi:hypothetical protein